MILNEDNEHLAYERTYYKPPPKKKINLVYPIYPRLSAPINHLKKGPFIIKGFPMTEKN